MAFGPINYVQSVLNPVDEALKGFQAGTAIRRQPELEAREATEFGNKQTQFANSLEDRDRRNSRQDVVHGRQDVLFGQQQDDRALKQAEVARQRNRAEAMRTAIAEAAIDPDAEKIAQLHMRFPELPKGFKIGWDLFDEENKKTRLSGMANVYSAITTGNNDVAEKLLTDRVEALRNSGEEAEAAQTEAVLELFKVSPEAAKMSMGMGLKALGGNDYDNILNMAKVSSSKSYGNGTVLKIMSNGKRVVTDPEGNTVTGPGAAKVMKEANEYDVLVQGNRSGARESEKLDAKIDKGGTAEQVKASAKAGIKIATDTFKSLGKVRKNIANIDLALDALKRGARTGELDSYLPSFNAATIELENTQRRMGLDVIGEVTFGALSQGELDLALATALPTKLNEDELADWLTRRKAAQIKYANVLRDAAEFLFEPGNTISDWIKQNKKQEPVVDDGSNTVGSRREQAIIYTNAEDLIRDKESGKIKKGDWISYDGKRRQVGG